MKSKHNNPIVHNQSRKVNQDNQFVTNPRCCGIVTKTGACFFLASGVPLHGSSSVIATHQQLQQTSILLLLSSLSLQNKKASHWCSIAQPRYITCDETGTTVQWFRERGMWHGQKQDK